MFCKKLTGETEGVDRLRAEWMILATPPSALRPLPRLRPRNSEVKSRPDPFLALHRHIPPMSLNKRLNDRQPAPGSHPAR